MIVQPPIGQRYRLRSRCAPPRTVRNGIRIRLLVIDLVQQGLQFGNARDQRQTSTDVAADSETQVLILAGAPLAGLANKIADKVPVPLVDGIQAAVTMAEGLVRMKPRKATSGTFQRPGPKDSKGLGQALADVIGHKD